MITRLSRLRYLRITGLAVAAVAVAGVAVVATASAAGMNFGFGGAATSTASGAELAALQARSSSAACTAFMQHFATAIGKSQAEVNAAFQKAIADTLADEVKGGKLTQAQADAIKQRLANRTPCALPNLAPQGKRGLGGYMEQYLTAAASALGISQAQLKTDIKNGQSLSQIAAAQKVSETDFRTRLIANLKPALDGAVTDKKITSTQEQTIISRLQSGPLPLWNRGPRHKPGPSPTPSAA